MTTTLIYTTKQVNDMMQKVGRRVDTRPGGFAFTPQTQNTLVVPTKSAKSTYQKESDKTVNTSVISNKNTTVLNTTLLRQAIAPPQKKEVTKSAEVKEAKEHNTEREMKFNFLEEYYFPYEKDPPIINSVNNNYKVIFIFKFATTSYLFIKRFDKEFKVSYYWAREEDVKKYGIDYNELNVPAIMFESVENFNDYSELKNLNNELQKKINEHMEVMSRFQSKYDALQREKSLSETELKKTRKKRDELSNTIKILSEENISLSNELEELSHKYSIVQGDREKFKGLCEKMQKKFDENKVFYAIGDVVNSIPDIISNSIETLRKKEKATFVHCKNCSLSFIGEEKKIKFTPEKDYEIQFNRILAKIQSEISVKEQDYEDLIAQINLEKNDQVSSLEEENMSLKEENQRMKTMISDLKYLIELREGESEKNTFYEEEISNLKSQIAELKNHNDYLSRLVREKEAEYESLSSDYKGILIELKEKENQIKDYSGRIEYLNNKIK